METFMILSLAVFGLVGFSQALTQAEIDAFVTNPHTESNTGLQGTVSVQVSSSNSNYLQITSNGIPDHVTGTFNGNPNYLAEQSYSYVFEKDPSIAASTSCVPQGPIAFAINGIPIFNAFTSGCCDAGIVESVSFDTCNGHPSPSDMYHYHKKPKCVWTLNEKPSPIIGVALDGFPIYGPWANATTRLKKNDLDACGGTTDPDGQYRYRVTNIFPYSLGCFKGTVVDNKVLNKINAGCGCTEIASTC